VDRRLRIRGACLRGGSAVFDNKRRKFITFLGGAVAGWPFIARAQEGRQLRLVGIVYDTSRGDPAITSQIAAFKEALQRLGWSEGRNIRFEGPFNLPDSATRQRLAKELVALKADVILTSGTPATAAFFAETRTIPIVFVNASDPIGSGFAVSLAHPDGNVTGFTNFEATVGQKWLELLKEIAPHIRRVRVIFNPETAVSGGRYFFEPIEMAARTQQIEAVALPVRSARDIERAIAVTADLSDVGVISVPDVFIYRHQDLVISLTIRHRIPYVCGNISYVRAGALLAYDIDRLEQAGRAASYVDRILKGERPGDLPIQGPVKFKLAINLKTAKTIGLEVPWFLQQRADDVIE
jgi:putative tryptophan/tyrosine transport system substrate-binding protein